MLACKDDAIRGDPSVEFEIHDKLTQIYGKLLDLIALVGHCRAYLHRLSGPVEQFYSDMIFDVLYSPGKS
jgi:hypothetical protein